MSPDTATDAIGIVPSGSQHSNTIAALPKYARNTVKMKHKEAACVNMQPARTESNPSPALDQSQTHSHVDGGIKYELQDAHYSSPDLAAHMFGHLVSTELARDILQHLLVKDAVRVFEGRERATRVCLSADSNGARYALDQAVKNANEHVLLPLNPQGASVSSQDPKTKTVYSWEWVWFPPESTKEDQLVSFFNEIIDTAFAFIKSRLIAPNNQLRHRFAAPTYKHQGIPLAYGAYGGDIRPDFFLLPTEAFLSTTNLVDENYIDFTAFRAVGESKNKALSEGINQVQRYLRGMRQSQPWVHFSIAMAVAKDRFCVLRGDSSGVERLGLTLTFGWSCLEFVRILLGLALADGVDLGQNPDVELGSEVRSCRLSDPPCAASNWRLLAPVHASAPSNLGPNSQFTRHWVKPLRTAQALLPKSPLIVAIVSQSSGSSNTTTSRESYQSMTLKRKRSEVDDESDDPDIQQPKKRRFTEVERRVFFPFEIHGYKSLGTLFTTCSLRGRSTVVLTVCDPNAQGKLLVLKMSWQDVRDLEEQNQVVARLEQRDPHANVIVPLKNFIASRKGKDCTTLGGIRGLVDDQLSGFAVENRALVVSVSELQRPVKYFWGVHDFVRGFRGALLGHEYLVRIGILHRDVSENNMLLARYPGGVRGYLIDLDLAILQEAEKPTEVGSDSETSSDDGLVDCSTRTQSETPQDGTKLTKGLRIGTMPYMSFNVLRGGKHTHFDDVESFLYVLLLFFFSYSGPLSKEFLRDADARGFVEASGSGRFSHMTRWPASYAFWAEGDFRRISADKSVAFRHSHADSELVNSPAVKECLKNWHLDLHSPIKVLLGSAWRLFSDSLIPVRDHKDHCEVSHAQFVNLLDEWLAEYAHLEKRFSNCPFEDPDAQ